MDGMMILVIGGSGSGKSAYAEELAVSLSYMEEELSQSACLCEAEEEVKNGCPGGHTRGAAPGCMRKYYLATMQVYDREGRRKVERHRKLRNGKGFRTIEQPTAIHRALEKMESGKRTALLECVSNLTANEMFTGEEPVPETTVVENIVKGIERLRESTTHLVVVSNNVFEDGIAYDAATMSYIHAMGMINRKLAAMAGRVVEVAAGIPVIIKQ